MKAEKPKGLPPPVSDTEMLRRTAKRFSRPDYWNETIPLICKEFGIGILDANHAARRWGLKDG